MTTLTLAVSLMQMAQYFWTHTGNLQPLPSLNDKGILFPTGVVGLHSKRLPVTTHKTLSTTRTCNRRVRANTLTALQVTQGKKNRRPRQESMNHMICTANGILDVTQVHPQTIPRVIEQESGFVGTKGARSFFVYLYKWTGGW
mmetsp:Transcript_58479/g.70392  ORF Transcript_58479/g.70392 Transcript_58479/m.70392 type:complete len:143 (+) Transcript_58479:67-495(+)